MTIQLPVTNGPLNRNIMQKVLLFLFFLLTPILIWGQRRGVCDSLFFADGTIAVVDSIKAVEGGLWYRLCGEKYGVIYEAKLTGLKKIRYRNGVQGSHFTQSDTLGKVEISILPEPQDTTRTWHVEMLDGNDYYGKILRKEARFYVFRIFDLGEINLPFGKIKRMSVEALPQRVGNQYWFRNPHATRYFFGTNGYGLRQGEGYYTNTWILYNHVSYGITDRFTLGAGTIPVFLFGASIFPFWVTPKFSFPLGSDKWNGAAGVLYMNVVGSDVGDFSGLGVTYGSLTYGSMDRNATFSFGYGFYDGQWAKNPTASFSAMHRVGRNGYFITENYLLPGYDSPTLLLSAGGRWVGKRIAIDYALVRPFGSSFKGAGFFVIPWLSITAPFGGSD